MSGDVRRGVVHRPPDLPVYQHTPPPSPSAWMGICLMFPSPLLLGLLASQTVSDTAVFQTHCHCFCFIFFPFKMPSWKILSKQMWICNCDGLFLPYLSTFLYFPSIMCPMLLMLFLTLSVCLSHPYFFTPPTSDHSIIPLFSSQCWTSCPSLPLSRPPPLRASYTMGGSRRKLPAYWVVGMRIWPPS